MRSDLEVIGLGITTRIAALVNSYLENTWEIIGRDVIHIQTQRHDHTGGRTGLLPRIERKFSVIHLHITATDCMYSPVVMSGRQVVRLQIW